MGVGAARSTKGLLPFSFNGVRAMAVADLLEPCKTMPTKALSSVVVMPCHECCIRQKKPELGMERRGEKERVPITASLRSTWYRDRQRGVAVC